MNEHFNALIEGMKSTDADVSRNAPFSTAQKVEENQLKSLQDSVTFDDLPNFCQHLPKEIKLAALSLKKRHNAPYEMTIPLMIGYINSAAQQHYNCYADLYGIRPISTFIMCMLDTAGGKTTIAGELEAQIQDWQLHRQRICQGEQARYASEITLYRKDMDAYAKEKQTNPYAVRPILPVAAETANYIVEKGTVNGIIDVLAGQRIISVSSDEAGQFFSGHSFQGNKSDASRGTEMITSLTRLWDGKPLTRIIKGETIVLSNRRANMIFLVQKNIIKDILKNPLYSDQGFIHRILLIDIPTFPRPDMDFSQAAITERIKYQRLMQPYLNKMKALLDKFPKTMSDNPYELDLEVLHCTDAARDLLGEFSNKYNNKITLAGERLHHFQGFAGRLHEHALRISATLAAFNGHVKIQVQDAQAGIDLVEIFIDQRHKLDLGMIDCDPDMNYNSEQLLKYFEVNKDKQFTVRELNRGPARNCNADQLRDYLKNLYEKDLIYCVERIEISKNGKTVTREYYGYKNESAVV